MTEIQRLTADQPDVRLVSLTVDPRTDTPEVLARFAGQFKADTNRWLFLTGDRRILNPLLEQSFLGRSQALASGGFAHTDQIVLVDPQGRLRATFDGMKRRVTDDVISALARLRAEGLRE